MEFLSTKVLEKKEDAACRKIFIFGRTFSTYPTVGVKGYCCIWSHTIRYPHPRKLPWTTEQLVPEICTSQNANKQDRQISIFPDGFFVFPCTVFVLHLYLCHCFNCPTFCLLSLRITKHKHPCLRREFCCILFYFVCTSSVLGSLF